MCCTPLRGEDADADSALRFKRLMRLWAFLAPRWCVDVAKFAQERDGNVEDVGRRVRYDASENCSKLCTEHRGFLVKAKI